MSFWGNLFGYKQKPRLDAIPEPPKKEVAKPKEEEIMSRAAEVIGAEDDRVGPQPERYQSLTFNFLKGIEMPKPLERGERYVIERAVDAKKYDLTERPMIVHLERGEIAASMIGNQITVTYWGPKESEHYCERVVFKKDSDDTFGLVSAETGNYDKEGVQYSQFSGQPLPPKIMEHLGGVKMLLYQMTQPVEEPKKIEIEKPK